ncbi:LysR family transcriptional regulator [Rhizobium glycinendophyticum]|uniref:HTH-type transcriptional regulator TtuA n=1 Tax=Rhizobium glycinendophyticum TaxID=2589807 RepID=A0A504TUD6_9HYPH|nr:LysR family transcriptional regulator [Rhizobium glycinendophyticum]TPP05010.1 LysR family transcriptional regulator [Rhizobium glycinendophyticum]
MDLRQLRYFRTIAEFGSISAASQQLGIAQPALSLHVRNMEERLGVKLLAREARGVSLTEAGELMARRSRMLLDEMTRLEDDIRNLGSSPTGDVRLGLPGTIGGILSVPLVLAGKESYPGIRLTIGEAMSGFVLDWLREGQTDIAILYLPAEDQRFRSDLLLSEELVLIAPKGAVMEEPFQPEHLTTVPLILPSPAHGLRTLLDVWAKQHRITLNATVELDSYSNIKTLVQQGYGYSILPLHAVAANAGDGHLRVLKFHKDELRRNVFLVWDTSRPSSHAAAAIIQLTRKIIDDLVGSGIWAGARQEGQALWADG